MQFDLTAEENVLGATSSSHMRAGWRRGVFALLRCCTVGAAALFVSGIALAQSVPTPIGELNILHDELDVNLPTLGILLDSIPISIGTANFGGLRYELHPKVTSGNILTTGSNFDLNVLVSYAGFNGLPFTYGDTLQEYDQYSPAPLIPDGSTLNATTVNFTHIARNGTASSSGYASNCSMSTGLQKYVGNEVETAIYGSTMLKPNGEKISYYYLTIYKSGCEIAHRLQSIKNNYGYAIHFDYVSNDQKSLDWRNMSTVTIYNGTVDFCDNLATSCSFTQNWPKLTINNFMYNSNNSSNWEMKVTEIDGTLHSFLATYGDGSLSVKRNSVELAKFYTGSPGYYFTQGSVTSVARAGATWAYSVADGSSETGDVYAQKVLRSSPLGNVRSVIVNPFRRNVLKYTDENNRATNYLYTPNLLLQYVVPPEGTLDASRNAIAGYTKFDYDSRGNVVQTTFVAKAGSSLANVSTSAGYDSTCSNRKTCNQPNWTRDGKGNQTDYTYDPNHGGLLSEMRPVPSTGAARPLRLFTYAQRSAWIKDASGSLVQSPDPVWLIASSIECQTAAGSSTPSCDGGALQTSTTYQYGAAGTSEAMLVKGIAVSSGPTTLRTCYGYDVFHRRISETKPNANLGVCP